MGALMQSQNQFPTLGSSQSGELAGLRVVSGPDAGRRFSILQPVVRIGRGDECQIVLTDLRASRIHLEITYSGDGWYVRDLGSANGYLLNGVIRGGSQFGAGGPTRDRIKLKDLIRIGDTVIEFLESNGKSGGAKVIPISNAGHKKKKPAVIIYVAVVGALLWVLMDDSTPKKTSKAKLNKALPEVETSNENLASFLPQNNLAADKSADAFVKIGFREYFLGNYLRAQQQFSTALQVDPRNILAKIYLENSTRALQRLVDFHRDQARKSVDAGRIKVAKNHYLAIIRILALEPENSAVREAKDRMTELKKLEAGNL